MERIEITVGSMAKIHKHLASFDKSLTGNADELFAFYRIWKYCDVYKVSCGYLRFEPYPVLGSATVHGMFFGNPFKHLQLLESVLYLYLEEHPYIEVLECHVPNEARGVEKLVAKIMTNSGLVKCNKKIYTFRR